MWRGLNCLYPLKKMLQIVPLTNRYVSPLILERINQTPPHTTIILMTIMPQVLPIRLSTHQITLLLSSIWVQSIYPLNTPENFEAIAHTYSLVLLVARSKVMWQILYFTIYTYIEINVFPYEQVDQLLTFPFQFTDFFIKVGNLTLNKIKIVS